jgi:hypothetical protein
MTIDTLHALNLGIMLTWCRIAVWFVLSSGVYGPGCNGPAGLTTCCLAMRASLFAWYRKRRADVPGECLTEVSDWVPSMIGTEAKPKLKTKGAETWALLLFLLDEIHRFGERLGNDRHRIYQAGRCLESLVCMWRGSTWKVTDAVVEDGA